MMKFKTSAAIRLATFVALVVSGFVASAAAKPNIIVIMADDVGWASLRHFPYAAE
jgi:hypothetical protein